MRHRHRSALLLADALAATASALSAQAAHAAAPPVDEAHLFEPHYDRHVWLWRDNPRGIFAQFNPNVSCAAHTGGRHVH